MLGKTTHEVQALDNGLVLHTFNFVYTDAIATAVNTEFTTEGALGIQAVSLGSTGTAELVLVRESIDFSTETFPFGGKIFQWKDGDSSVYSFEVGSTAGACDRVLLGAFANCSDPAIATTSITEGLYPLVMYVGALFQFFNLAGTAATPADGSIISVMLVFKNSGLAS